MTTMREQYKHDLPWIGGGAMIIIMLIEEVEALKLAQQKLAQQMCEACRSAQNGAPGDYQMNTAKAEAGG